MNTVKNSGELYLLSTDQFVNNHNSYAQLCRYLEGACKEIICPPSPMTFSARLIGKSYDVMTRRPVRDKSISYVEWKFDFLDSWGGKGALFHFLFGDAHIEFIRKRKRRAGRLLVCTVHQPFGNWADENIQALRDVDGLIVLCEPDRTQFAEALPGLPVVCIPHGIDTNYWRARPFPSARKKRIGYCGRHLRNAAMFIRVAKRVLEERDDVEVECLITLGGMTQAWVEFGENANVRILQNLSQDEVLDFYQGLYVLLMPLNDTTANNAVVESMSCAIPVLTTRVGGIGSYGGGSIYPAVENDDDDALYRELVRFLDDPELCRKVGENCRQYAEEHLSWDRIAARHMEFYQTVRDRRAA